jgi:hypothetical protein
VAPTALYAPNDQLGINFDYPIIQCISLDPESNMDGQHPNALMLNEFL